MIFAVMPPVSKVQSERELLSLTLCCLSLRNEYNHRTTSFGTPIERRERGDRKGGRRGKRERKGKRGRGEKGGRGREEVEGKEEREGKGRLAIPIPV